MNDREYAKTRRPRIKNERQVHPRGWTRWIHPTMTGYLLVCCDCGLAHELEFKATEYGRGGHTLSGVFRFKELPRSKYGVMFRARRAPRESKSKRKSQRGRK